MIAPALPAHPQRRTLIGTFVAAAIFQSLMQSAAAAGPPVLPTPCIGGPCGRNAGATPFVTSGVASAVVSGNNLTVNQQSNSAILNWQNFNIGSGNSVTFNQPSATAAALNRIWSADPSVIAGALKANGQIYLLNQNGIVFANGAQVNVGSLTASTLDISDQTFLKGLLSGNTGDLTNGGILPPVFQQAPGADPKNGTVAVAPGATIQTADGGRVMLIGTSVSNAGKISTPDGQAILAAGTTVYLASTTDPSLRGLLIAVDSGEVADNSTVKNSGTISADRGNVTLAGMVVNQAGRVTATTSVSANGSIYLVAGDADPNSDAITFYGPTRTGFNAGQLMPNVGGTVTLEPGSVTEVQPDTSSTTTITNAQTFYPSQVSVVGKNVNLQGNAQITAPGGQVNLIAFDNPFKAASAQIPNHTLPTNPDGGRVYLDSASSIDVSGLQNVSAPAAQNLVQIQLGANELQDDPLLRTGFLHGATVTIDLAKGTPLLNQTTLKSYADTVGHSLQEVLTSGGAINLSSGGDVITRAGSVQNVSGGSIAYQSSSGATTKLLGANGKVYDIGSAPSNIQYLGFADSYSYTDPRWGTKTSFSASGTVAGYLQGSAAGTISVLSPNFLLAGKMLATTTPGPYQRSAATLPTGGTFSLGDASPTIQAGESNFDAPSLNLIGSVADTLGKFDPAAGVLPALDFADVGVGDLAANGFNHLSLASNGSVVLPSSTHLKMAGNGSLTINAAAVTLSGSIHSSDSAISLKTNRGMVGDDPTAAHSVTLDPGAVIDVSGNWVNDSPLVTTALGTGPTLLNGGSVSIQAAADSDVVLGAGSRVDVSGGGWISSANQLQAGSGGSISVKSGGPLNPPAFALGGVSLLGDLRGAALKAGGSLVVTSAWVTVAGDATGKTGELVLNPDFFTQGGFGSYNITGINGVTIGSSKAGAQELIQPLQQNRVFNGSMLLQKSAANIEGFTSLQTLAQEYRKPTDVSFASTLSGVGLTEPGNLTFNRGATIATDPGATVSLAARENLTVSGVIKAPAGTINLTVAPGVQAGSAADSDGYIASQQLLITRSAQLLAPGYAAIYTDNPKGFRQGQILSGGTVNIVANKGSVVAQTGAIIDVSGVSGVVDVAQQNRSVVPTTVAGSAGSINVEAMSDIVLNSTLRGNAADVPGAAGGSLFVGLDRFNLKAIGDYNNDPAAASHYPQGDRNLIITSQDHLSDGLPVDDSGAPVDGVAKISAGTINAGGFDNVRLNSVDIVSFDGSAALTTRSTLSINALQIAATPGARASLNSAYVSFGNNVYSLAGQDETGRVYSPALGDGTLSVTAGTIDLVGNTSLSGFQSAAFNAANDIRLTYGTGTAAITDFTGSLESSADLVFKATQIYPTTGATFTINPTDAGSDPTSPASYSYAPGKVTILPVAGSAAQTPLSALGTVNINSPVINQYGVLTAPFGQIQLNGVGNNSVVALHAGSVTAVSAGKALIPYGSTQNGRQWTYQVDDNGTSSTQLVLGHMPSKQVALNGSDVILDPNSKVDVSGGGDLYAYEFIAGTGGSRDVLLPGNGYQYAILPSLGSAFAPIDHQYSIGSNIAVGKQVYLSGVPGLAAGYYTLLPARYALLPGAFAVSVVQQNSDVLRNSAVLQPGGGYLVAGQFSQVGTNILDGRTSTFLVASSSVVRTQSEYTDTYANSFFYNAAVANNTNAVNLPADAGQLALSAGQQLHLQGSVGFSPAQFVAGKDAKGNDITVTGAGGTASIVASRIEVVEPGAAQDGSLQLTAESLNGLGASVLILGATRVAGSDADTLNVGATSVTLANGSADPLTAPEIILAAAQTVSLGAGSAINSTGTSNDKTTLFKVAGDGALLRASSGAQATVVRTGFGDTPAGTLQIASGTSIAAQSLVLDAAANTQLDSGSSITAQSVEASSGRVSLGDVPTGTAGLNVTNALLSNFKGLTDLSLRSASTIDFYGSVDLGTTGSGGAPTLQTVTFDSAALAGYGTGNKTVTAGNIVLMNSGAAQSTPPFVQTPDGTGQLTLTALGTAKGAPQITLGAGTKAIAGFGGVTLSASSGDIRGMKTGSLTLTDAGDLTLSSARFSTDSAARQTIQNSTGSVTIAGAGSAAALGAAGMGGQLSVSGTAAAGSSAIVVSSLVALPSGTLNLQAQGGGDLTITGTGQINAAGVVKPYYNTYAASDAGSVTLASTGGNVAVQSGAIVDVSGVSSADGKVSGDAGSLSILAPQGQFLLAGTLRGSAAAGQKGGDFALDTTGNADHSGAFSVSTLGLSSNGFTGGISIRDRNDSAVVVDGTNRARSFSLTADAGTISVTGSVDTSGATNNGGGDISLWAGHDLTLASGSRLTSAAGKSANGNTLRGGNVALGSAGGVITLADGSSINLSGSAGKDNPGVNPDGQLRLLAAYNSATGTLGVNPISATLTTTNPAIVVVDAGWSYNNVTSLGGDLTLDQIATGIQAFSAQAPGLAAGLTPTGAAFSVQVRPWITVSSPGDLTVSSVVDLHSLAANSNGGVPVDLTLRAAGNLLVDQSITDGFVAAKPNAALTLWDLVSGNSANLQLAAGADLASANPLAAQSGSGTFVLAPATLIRTGNGNIDIAAGHEVCIGCGDDGTVSSAPNAKRAVIYTAGQPSTNAPVTFTVPGITTANVTPQFATDGGNISITSGGDILSAPSTNIVSNWLWRQGDVKGDGSVTRDTAWWVESNAFQEGVGALGGGNITVQAAGNISDLSVVIPTTGRVGVAAGTSTLSADTLVVNGGGDLRVRAGGNLQGGLFEADIGYGAISAGGDIGVSASTGFAPVLVLADSAFALHAGGSVMLDGVLNSTFTPEAATNTAGIVNSGGLGLARKSYFYTYSPDSAVSVTSGGGDVNLNNNLKGFATFATSGGVIDNNALTDNDSYPATLNVAALSGDVTVGGALTLFPSSSGNLTVLAQNGITLNGSLSMSELEPAQVGSILAPINAAAAASLALGTLPSAPLHAGDPNPIRLIAATGNIDEPVNDGSNSQNVFAKQADIVAGGDILNLNLVGKNLSPADVTLIQAGGKIFFDTTRSQATNQLSGNATGIQVGGPGYVEVVAGGDIELGDSTGVVTTGRLNDARLPAIGATLVTAAGLGNNADGSLRAPSYDAFINKYIAATSVTSYATNLLGYVRSLFPTRTDLTASNALAVFQSLSRPQQLPFISQVLTDELSATGLAHTIQGTSYQRGYDAINTLFPTKDAQGKALQYKGDINMFFSQLKTAQGGDIDLLAPGGSVVVGVPNPPDALRQVKGQDLARPPISAESNLGLLVLAQGAIQGMANGDFDVNQSRVLTLQGGDIILWASTGSIDAGKGAKTAQGAPPPVIQTDTQGNIFVNPVGAVAGSGIGQLLTVQGIKAGLVNLIAPTGVVNAGEAGIRVAGDLNIAATAVLNVGNIKVGGTATGLPVSDAGALSGALSGANALGDAGKTVADQLTQNLTSGNNLQQLTDSLAPSFITVRMFCLGVQCDAQ